MAREGMQGKPAEPLRNRKFGSKAYVVGVVAVQCNLFALSFQAGCHVNGCHHVSSHRCCGRKFESVCITPTSFNINTAGRYAFGTMLLSNVHIHTFQIYIYIYIYVICCVFPWCVLLKSAHYHRFMSLRGIFICLRCTPPLPICQSSRGSLCWSIAMAAISTSWLLEDTSDFRCVGGKNIQRGGDGSRSGQLFGCGANEFCCVQEVSVSDVDICCESTLKAGGGFCRFMYLVEHSLDVLFIHYALSMGAPALLFSAETASPSLVP
eukprot:284815774_6